MGSPLQKKDTGKIKSKVGHAEPPTKSMQDSKYIDGGSKEIHGNQRGTPAGHPEPGHTTDDNVAGDHLKSELSGTMKRTQNLRASAMDAAHMRGKKDITKAANEE